MANKTKEKLDGFERVLGCFIGFYSPAMVEILGLCGFDFVVIDNEHGPFSWGQIEHMVRAAQLRNLTPIVRTVDHEQGTILKALDCGAQGVHVPQVSTADQTESIVRAAKFPPEGTRGVAWSARSHLYGAGDGAGYLRRHNEESIVVVHVETEEAVENIEEIASVPGLDVAYVGPADLSVALGHASEGPSHSEVRGAADRVLEACRERGMHVGYHVGGAQQARETFAWGASYVGVGITPVLFAAFKEVVGARDASLPHS